MSELSRQMSEMLDHRDLILAALADACPGVQWHIWDIAIDDRREFFWRLADNDGSLVYGESRMDAADIGENTFVEDVECVWRPRGEDFVVALVDPGLGGNSQAIAVMALKMELPKPLEGTS